MLTPHRSATLLLVLLSSVPLVVLGCTRAGEHPIDPAGVAGSEVGERELTGAPMDLPESPKAALAQLRTASMKGPVAVFKHSPICPISGAAHRRFQAWMGKAALEGQVRHAHIDVIGQKPLARGLVAELGIKHESPQALLFHRGEVVWHASHEAITGEALTEQIDQLD